MEHKTYRGKILYIGDDAGERGREWFTLTCHSSGERTLRTLSEIDESQILRDTVMSFDGRWKPLDAFVRLTVKDRFIGSGWYKFFDQGAECQTFTADGGRISQKMAFEDYPPSFAAHSLAGDIWLTGAFDRTNNESVQTIEPILMSSLLPDGSSGPMLGRTELSMEYLGKEDITVPAGTFEADHFRYLLANMDLPDEDVWCFGEDLIFVKARWDLYSTTYELVALESL